MAPAVEPNAGTERKEAIAGAAQRFRLVSADARSASVDPAIARLVDLLPS